MPSISQAQSAIAQFANTQTAEKPSGFDQNKFSQLVTLLGDLAPPQATGHRANGTELQAPGAFATGDDVASMQASLLSALKQSVFSANHSAPEASMQATEQVAKTYAKETGKLADDIRDIVERAKTYSFGEDGFQADDVFDTLNMLHHIPLVSDVYQQVTEDSISAAASVVGSFIFAGPLGVAYSAADLIAKEVTGDSMFNNIVQFTQDVFSGDSDIAQKLPEKSSPPIASDLIPSQQNFTTKLSTR
ncbi:hypothetical protein [Bowmanella yangjiangensis]|uniref:Uncharacterized protein n=1 Tax=Bowmanella yangjiangensis TaxID=2811230 RepID=A0ABS3CSJ7_9ALTE|nr:hypothetical protein [Bowmanella yangjiangensis]MBN7820093.1 hypothetical protein [Bowmanella yangjiangensis]